MNARLKMQCDWLEGNSGEPAEVATFGALLIDVGGHVATRVIDQESKLEREAIFAAAFPLAAWLAHNWWRLLWEPERSDSPSWGEAHQLLAAGWGYFWPDLTLSSDGESVSFVSRATPAGEQQLVRYIENFTAAIPIAEFEREAARFIGTVIDRLDGKAVREPDLAGLWQQVVAEREDPQMSAWRKLEAMLGCDPDEAPDQLLESLQAKEQAAGTLSVQEMAAAFAHGADTHLETLLHDVRPHAIAVRIPGIPHERGNGAAGLAMSSESGQSGGGSSGGEMENRGYGEVPSRAREAAEVRVAEGGSGYQEAGRQGSGQSQGRANGSLPPWQRGEKLARLAREAWQLDSGPISSDKLTDLLGVARKHWQGGTSAKTPVSVAFRDPDGDSATALRVNWKPRRETQRRFDLARLAGDHLTVTHPGEIMLPATQAGTARQKFQRAFASEFLCPFQDLIAFLGTDGGIGKDGRVGDDEIDSAAEHFQVSPLLIKTKLVTKRRLQPDVLEAAV